jgi:hypothetical protein
VILLQAAIAAGFFLFILFGAFLLIVTPKLVGLLMKFIWRRQNKEDYLKNNTPYYKDPVLYFPCLILSIIILSYMFYLLLLLFDKLIPNWGLYT